MNDFEFLRNITVGQYLPTGSVVHGLDPRSKLLACVFLMLAVSFSPEVIPSLLLLTTILLITRVARIPVKYILRGIILGLPILILILVIQLLLQGWSKDPGKVYFEWHYFRFTRYSIYMMSSGFIRIVCFIFITSLLTMTTTTAELTHGMESLFRPFQRFRFPAHELALISMITVRFVPTLAEELGQIRKAQASRCADVDGQRFYRPDKKAKALLPLIVPLFTNAFRRADELVIAMEARCYIGGEGRTKFIILKSRPRDYLVMTGLVVLLLLIYLNRWPEISELLSRVGINGL